jgi:hypothetical protein
VTVTTHTNHTTEAHSLLAEQFKRSAVLATLLKTFIARIQGINEQFGKLVEERRLSSAVGFQLNGLGQIVGAGRFGSDDGAYRTKIAAKIKLNLSSGTPNQIIELLSLATLQANTFHLREYPPAGFTVTINEPLTVDATALLSTFSEAKPAAVDANIIIFSVPRAEVFQLDGTSTQSLDAGKMVIARKARSV